MTTPSPFRTASTGDSTQVTLAAGVSGMSPRNFSDRREVLTYRQHFAFVWQKFITENFVSPAHAAHVFQVDPTTAEKWFRGLNAPSGWVVGKAISDPETRAAVLTLLAGES